MIFKIFFYRSNTQLNNDYHIDGDQFVEINIFHNLELIFQPNLLFFSYIIFTCSKALRSFGFSNRNTKEFNNYFCLKTLYTSLVEPIQEFDFVLWNLSHIICTESLGRIHRTFFRLITHKRYIHVHFNSSSSILFSSI
jgi:hypothetical protein